MRKTSRRVLKVLSEVDDGRVEICRFPPALVDRDVRLVKTLRDMLSLKWRRSRTSVPGTSRVEVEMNLDREWDHVLDVTLEGVLPPWVDMPHGYVIRHRCVGPCRFAPRGSSEQVNCASDADTTALLRDALVQCFITKTAARFQTGRWTKTFLSVEEDWRCDADLSALQIGCSESASFCR